MFSQKVQRRAETTIFCVYLQDALTVRSYKHILKSDTCSLATCIVLQIQFNSTETVDDEPHLKTKRSEKANQACSIMLTALH